MKQLTRVTQFLFSLGAAEFVRRDGAHEAMTRRSGIVLGDQLQADRQRGDLHAEPRDGSPDGGGVESPFIDRLAGLCLISDHSVGMADDRSIRFPIVVEIVAAAIQERFAVVSLIGKNESRGNR